MTATDPVKDGVPYSEQMAATSTLDIAAVKVVTDKVAFDDSNNIKVIPNAQGVLPILGDITGSPVLAKEATAGGIKTKTDQLTIDEFGNTGAVVLDKGIFERPRRLRHSGNCR